MVGRTSDSGRRRPKPSSDAAARVPGLKSKSPSRRAGSSSSPASSKNSKKAVAVASSAPGSAKRGPGSSKESPRKRARGGNAAAEARGGEQVVDGFLDMLRGMVDGDGSSDDEEVVELLEAVKMAGDMEEELDSEMESVQDSPSEGEAGLDAEVDSDTIREGCEEEEEEEDGESSEDGDEAGVDRGGDDVGKAEEGGSGDDDAAEGDIGSLGMHKKDLEGLKESDPSFYKYLQENDAKLLDLEGDDGSDGEKESGEDSSGSEMDDGDSDADAEEAAALAEAGLAGASDLDDGSEEGSDDDAEGTTARPQESGKRQNRSLRFVDMAAVREIEEQLALNRGALKAVKDLMRMLRAGRDLTTVAQGGAPSKQERTATGRAKAKAKAKAKARAKGGRGGIGSDDDDSDDEDDEDDLMGSSDGGFMAGDVKFASARVYQKVMYLAIVKVQETLDRLLGKPKVRPGSVVSARWTPTGHARWRNLETIFRSFSTQLFALTEGMQDPATLRFLLKRAEMLVPYTRGNQRLTRRLIKLALGVWSPETRDIGEASKLRAYLLLRAIANEPENVQPVLRAVYNSYYTTIAKACNPRTLPNILFSAKCIVDLFGMDMAASYTVVFSYLREMAVTLRAVLTSKDQKTDVDKIHNWSFVNALRLWSLVLSTYGGEDELRPLVYPYVQVAIGVMRVQPTPRSYPLRLHISSYLTNIVSETGIYIPVASQLLVLLRCAELRKKPARGSTKDLEWRSLLRVGDEVVKTKPFLTGLVNGTVLQLAAFYGSFSRHVSFPELSHQAAQVLRKFSKEVKVNEWRTTTVSVSEKLKETAMLVANARARASFGPHGAAGTQGMLEVVPSLDKVGAKGTPVQRFYNVEAARVKREEAMRDEALQQKHKDREFVGKTSGKAAGQQTQIGRGQNEGDADCSGDESGDSADSSDLDEDVASSASVSDSEDDSKVDKKKGKKKQRVATPAAKPPPMFVFQNGDDADSDEMEALVLSSDEE